MYEKVLKYTQLFYILWATHFGQRPLKQRKIIGVNRFKYICCVKVIMANLHKIGLTMRE